MSKNNAKLQQTDFSIAMVSDDSRMDPQLKSKSAQHQISQYMLY